MAMRVAVIFLALNGAVAFHPSSAGDSLVHTSSLSQQRRTQQNIVRMLNKEAAHSDLLGLERRRALQHTAAALALLLPLSSKAVRIPNPDATPPRDDITQISLFEESVLKEAASDLNERFKVVDDNGKAPVKFFIDLMSDVSNMEYDLCKDEARMNKQIEEMKKLKDGPSLNGVQKLLPAYFKAAKKNDAEKLVVAAIAIGEAVEEWSADYQRNR